MTGRRSTTRPILTASMAGRVLLRRRALTAAAIYGGTALGVLGTIVAARLLGPEAFGLLAITLATAGVLMLLLDTTVEEAVVKYGIRYATAGDWGRLRRLVRVALGVKWLGGLTASLLVLVLAPFANTLFGSDDLTVPFLLAALLPVAQSPEGLAGAALLVRGRYDLRALLMGLAMGLRFAGVAVGASFGVAEAVAGVVVAQVVASGAVGLVSAALFRSFPRATHVPLGADRGPIARFVAQSALGTTLVSVRQTAAPALLGLVSTPTQVGFFRTAQAPMTGFQALSAPARLILLTEQTQDAERGRTHTLFRTLRRYMTGATLLMLAAVPVFWLALPWLVEVVYGADFAGAASAARILLLAAAVQLVLGWTKSFPVSIGRPGLRVVSYGVETAVVLPLLLVLGTAWGAEGAAAAVLAGTLAFAVTWAVLLVRLRREPRPFGPAPDEVAAP